MHDFIEILTKKLDQALEETVKQIDQQEEKIDLTISDLSLKKKSLNEEKQQTLKKQNDHSLAIASQTKTQSRYSQVLSQMVDDLKEKDNQSPPKQEPSNIDIQTSTSSFSNYPIVHGDIYQTYRLTAGQSNTYQQIALYNQFYTDSFENYLYDSSKFPIYIIDIVHLLKTLFNEIRHVESCHKYQEADWKTNQVNVVLNESYRTLILLIEELLASYNANLQVAPISTGEKTPSKVRIRTGSGAEQVVDITEFSKSVEQVTKNSITYRSKGLGQSRTGEFAGFLKSDVNIVFPLSTFDILNPNVLRIILGEFKQRQHQETMEYWRQSELRIQKLGDSFKAELHEQLIGWLG